MDSVLKRINEKKFDEGVHGEFIKFSKGVFNNKYLVDAKKQKDKWSIKTGAEFVNFIVRRCLEDASGKIPMKGVIVSTFDLRNEVKFPIGKMKQFMGIKQLVLETEVDPKEIIALMDKFPRAFYALSFSTPKCDLKIKAKAPKSAKPASSGDKEVSADFCSMKTTDKSLVDDLLFDCADADVVSIKHTLKIEDIILPKGEKDPVQIREKAVRKGVIVRRVKIGDKETIKELAFEA